MASAKISNRIRLSNWILYILRTTLLTFLHFHNALNSADDATLASLQVPVDADVHQNVDIPSAVGIRYGASVREVDLKEYLRLDRLILRERQSIINIFDNKRHIKCESVLLMYELVAGVKQETGNHL